MVTHFPNNMKETMDEDVAGGIFQMLKNALTSSFMIMVMDSEGKVMEVNDRFIETFKYSLSELYMQDYKILNSGYHSDDFLGGVMNIIHNKEQWSGELCLRSKMGEFIWLNSSIIPLDERSHCSTRFIMISSNVTDQKAMEKWQHIACHNDLTNLPNRRMFNLSIESYFIRAKQTSSRVAILYMDINRFKLINDTYGHSIGDLFLKELGIRLSSLPTMKNHIFHISGDEFVIVIEDSVNFGEQALVLLELFNKSFLIGDIQLQASASIGISLYPDHGTDIKMLIDYADAAMFLAKRDEVNSCRIHNPLKSN